MPMTHGADPEQLDDLAMSFERQAAALRESEHALSNLVAGVGWRGPAAERFRTTWRAGHASKLMLVSGKLQAAGKDLRIQAAQQRTASNGSGAGGGAGLFGPGATASASGGLLTGIDIGRKESEDPLFKREVDPHRLVEKQYGEQDDEAAVKARQERIDADLTIAKGEAGAEAHVGEAKAAGGFGSGPLRGKGDASIDLLQAKAGADGSVMFGRDGLAVTGGASAAANLVNVNAGGSLAAYGMTVANATTASVGADATANGHAALGLDGLNAGASGEVFVGAEADTNFSASAAGVSGTADASIRAGFGIEGGADVDASLDKVRLKANFGATLGVGGSLGFDVSISPKETLASIGGGVKDLGTFLL